MNLRRFFHLLRNNRPHGYGPTVGNSLAGIESNRANRAPLHPRGL